MTLLLAIASLQMLLDPRPELIAGRATIIDGDTLEIRGQRLRLWGVDAPESRQSCTRNGEPWRCGQQAALNLDALIGDRPVSCEARGRPDRYRRIVAVCWSSLAFGPESELFKAPERNLGAAQVAMGFALDWPRYSGGVYLDHQREAQQGRLGIWAGEFQTPWEWRAAR